MPQQIVLAPPPLANTYTSIVTVAYRGTNAVKVSDARVNLPGVDVSLREVQPGHTFQVQVLFPAGFKADPALRGAITVKTDHPKYEELVVPILQLAPAAATRTQGPLPAAPQKVNVSQRTVPIRPAQLPTKQAGQSL